MEIGNPTAAAAPTRYRVLVDGKRTEDVCPDKLALAAQIDTSKDGVLSDGEIQAYLRKVHILRDAGPGHVNTEHLVSDFKRTLEGRPLDQAAAYHSYDQMHDVMAGLAQQHPDRAQLVSLGKSVEGRDLWALHISGNVAGDTTAKPGVVFTGCTHAREWMSMEVPLDLATHLVNDYDTDAATKKRVDNGDTWIVPLVNPDGYEYSRTQDPWWRKNREPITNTGCGGQIAACNLPEARRQAPAQPVAMGVDLNRNYDDGKPEHEALYRPAGDTPCNTNDDFGETSDDPQSDVYRGPKGASEPEVQALLALDLGRPNIRGVIDHHSYSELFLRPWGGTHDKPDNIKDYDDVAARMRAAQSNPYTYESGMDLYPTAGTSTDILAANGKIAFTIELGQEFQPDPATFDKMNVENADLAFLDWIEEKYPAPTPAPTPPPMPAPGPPHTQAA